MKQEICILLSEETVKKLDDFQKNVRGKSLSVCIEDLILSGLRQTQRVEEIEYRLRKIENILMEMK